MGGLTSISGPLTTQPVSARQTTDASNAAKVTIALLGDLLSGGIQQLHCIAPARGDEIKTSRDHSSFSGGDWRRRAPLTRSLARGVEDTEASDLRAGRVSVAAGRLPPPAVADEPHGRGCFVRPLPAAFAPPSVGMARDAAVISPRSHGYR